MSPGYLRLARRANHVIRELERSASPPWRPGLVIESIANGFSPSRLCDEASTNTQERTGFEHSWAGEHLELWGEWYIWRAWLPWALSPQVPCIACFWLLLSHMSLYRNQQSSASFCPVSLFSFAMIDRRKCASQRWRGSLSFLPLPYHLFQNADWKMRSLCTPNSLRMLVLLSDPVTGEERAVTLSTGRVRRAAAASCR